MRSSVGSAQSRFGTSEYQRLRPDELPRPKPRELEAPIPKAATGPGVDPRRQPAMAGVSAVGLSKRGFDGVREAAMAELAASLPAPHSFGRRGR